jgi:hypothetical protein
MNPDQESLILAYDALLETRDLESKKKYDSLLAKTLLAHPGLSRESLHAAIIFAHRKWLQGERSDGTPLPPSA